MSRNYSKIQKNLENPQTNLSNFCYASIPNLKLKMQKVKFCIFNFEFSSVNILHHSHSCVREPLRPYGFLQLKHLALGIARQHKNRDFEQTVGNAHPTKFSIIMMVQDISQGLIVFLRAIACFRFQY
jgi:hypothetical protein